MEAPIAVLVETTVESTIEGPSTEGSEEEGSTGVTYSEVGPSSRMLMLPRTNTPSWVLREAVASGYSNEYSSNAGSSRWSQRRAALARGSPYGPGTVRGQRASRGRRAYGRYT